MKMFYSNVLFLLIAGPGCRMASDANQARATTVHNLNRWESYINLCLQYAFPIETCNSIDEAVALLKRHNLFDLKTDETDMLMDYWGRKYNWSVSKDRDKAEVRIRIISNGGNGVFEQGRGDDIVFQALISSHGQVTAKRAY